MKKIYFLFIFVCFILVLGKSQNCELNCISKVNVSLKPNECIDTLTPYDFITNPTLAPSPACQAYVLKFLYPYGTHVYTPATILDLSHAGYSMTYQVSDSVSHNYCWGTLKVNYCNACAIKTPPMFTSFTTSAGPYIPGSNITLTATATDNISISKIEFYNYGSLIGVDYNSAYSVVYKFDSIYGSVNQFKAIAYDNCGDTASSSVIKIITASPSCNDGYKNGSETGIDCGGNCIIACPPSPCATPYSLYASVYGSDVTLSWSGPASYYLLEIVNTVSSITVVTIPAASSPFHISLVDGSYKFRVKSKCGYDTSSWSTYKPFVINTAHPWCYEPNNLSYVINGSTATLYWSGSASLYHLEVINTWTNAIILSDLHATSPYIVYNLSDGYYSFRVKSLCNYSYSEWSSSVPFSIHDYHPPVPPPCYTPTYLVTSVVGDEAHLSWTGNASQYQVQIEDAHTYSSIVSIYLDNTYFNTHLVSGDYRWRVRCYCGGNYSDWSSWKTFTIPSYYNPPPCDPPYHLASSVNNGQVSMTWAASASEYDLELHHMETGEIHSYKSSNPYMNMSMSKGSYQFKIKCHCGSSVSNWSDWSSFIVPAGNTTVEEPLPVPCEVPFQLSSTASDQNVRLAWSGISSKYFLEVEALNNTKSIALDVTTAYYNTTLNNGTYKFRVKSQCGDWTAWTYFTLGNGSSSEGLPKIDSTCLNVPVLNLTYVGDSALTLRWSPTDLHTLYSIEIKSEFAPIKYQFKIDGFRDSVIRVSGLIPNTQYTVSFKADCGNGVSVKTWEFYTVTLTKLPTTEETVSKLSCIKPSGTSVKVLSSTKAHFSWLSVPRGRNYFVEILSLEGTPSYNKKATLSYLNDYEVSDLVAGGTYTFRVDAECYFSKSGYSNVIRFTMPSDLNILAKLESRSVPESMNMTLFPNPARSLVNIRFEKPVQNINLLQIINIQGQVVRDVLTSIGNQTRVSLDGIRPGIYFIKARSNQSSLVQKLIVE
ncbi:MAG: T9SS type A sorting domain-containing protein [Saprospiraceae bacterium]